MPYNAANIARDRELRKKLLTILYLARVSPDGGGNGRWVKRQVEALGPDSRFDSDDQAVRLMRDLVAKGYATESKLTRRVGQAFSTEFLHLTITGKGVSLEEQSIPADPDIDDERISE